MTNIQLLEKAIEKILSVYNSISVKWFEYKSGKLYNQSKILVKQISRDSEYFIDIKDYTKFLCNEKIHEMEFGLENNIINQNQTRQFYIL